MPVAQGPRFNLRSAAVLGGIALLVAITVGFTAITLGQRSSRLVLGDLDFRSLNTDNMAEEIDENGPILWPDVASGSRDIWLQHLGDDNASGWSAFDARSSGAPRECNVQWVADDDVFVDPCSSGITYLADGTGLSQIPVYLDGAELIIDINGVRDPAAFAGYRVDR